MQLVKRYVDTKSDFKIVSGKRTITPEETAIQKINKDLAENKVWTIHSLLVAGDKSESIIVVYNIEESVTLKRTLNEGSVIYGGSNSDEVNQLKIQYADK